MPKLLRARPPQDAVEERQIRNLAGSRHAPGDWIRRAQIIVLGWDGQHTSVIAATLGCHPQTVRERLVRFNAEGLDGLGDRPGPGRPRRLGEAERSRLIALARSQPPGRLVWDGHHMVAPAPGAPAHWSLYALAAAAHAQGIAVGRGQIRRILRAAGVRWRPLRLWATSSDPDFSPKEHGSSPSILSRRPGRRSSVWTSSGR